MKVAAALALAAAPLALGKTVRNLHPKRGIQERTNHQTETEQYGQPWPNGMDGWGIGETTHKEVIIIWYHPGGEEPTKTIINEQHPVPEMAEGGHENMEAPPMATHTISVGGPAGLAYSPDQIQANLYDMVIFEFWAQNHTVTQSTFGAPCDAMEGGMESGFQPNPDNNSPPPRVAMQVMTTDPLWFYCRQGAGGHCGQGMVFSINPTVEKSHALFQAKAIEQKGNGEGTPLTGGDATPEPAPEAPELEPMPGTPEGSPTVVENPTGTGKPDTMATGTGTVLPDGSCQCVAYCGSWAFPDKAQGANAYGGMAAAVPMNMAVA